MIDCVVCKHPKLSDETVTVVQDNRTAAVIQSLLKLYFLKLMLGFLFLSMASFASLFRPHSHLFIAIKCGCSTNKITIIHMLYLP